MDRAWQSLLLQEKNVNNHSQQHKQAPMNKTDAESLQRREYFSGQADAGLRDWKDVLRVCWKARHRGARGQQLNHLCEQVESDIKHLTWKGQRALNQQPKPLGMGGGSGWWGRGRNKQEKSCWNHFRGKKLNFEVFFLLFIIRFGKSCRSET